MKCARSVRAGAVALLALTASACMAIDTQTNKGYKGPLVYSGTRYDASVLGNAFVDLSIGGMMFALIDLPFSFLVDTVLLPVTIPRDAARSDQAGRGGRRWRPSARARCSRARTRRRSPRRSGCSRRARSCCATAIRTWPTATASTRRSSSTAQPPLRGAEYKPLLREGLERAVTAYQSLDWREPAYQLEGERVRITAVRGSSADPARTPLVLVVGASADGSWRIVEEKSVGWPEPP